MRQGDDKGGGPDRPRSSDAPAEAGTDRRRLESALPLRHCRLPVVRVIVRPDPAVYLTMKSPPGDDPRGSMPG
jgi:hypothetical protein